MCCWFWSCHGFWWQEEIHYIESHQPYPLNQVQYTMISLFSFLSLHFLLLHISRLVRFSNALPSVSCLHMFVFDTCLNFLTLLPLVTLSLLCQSCHLLSHFSRSSCTFFPSLSCPLPLHGSDCWYRQVSTSTDRPKRVLPCTKLPSVARPRQWDSCWT